MKLSEFANIIPTQTRIVRKIKVVEFKSNKQTDPTQPTSVLYHIFGLDDNKKKILLQTSKSGTIKENYKYAEREFLNQEIPVFEKENKLFRLTNGKFVIDGPTPLTGNM